MNNFEYHPFLNSEEIKATTKILSGKKISIYNDSSVFKFEKKFAKLTGNKYAIATNTGSAALHSTLLALGIKESDEVIVQGMNFISVIYSIMYCNAEPIFSDIDARTNTMEWEQIKPLVTKKTKAIIVSSIFGLMPDIDRIVTEAHKKGIYIVEDLSQSYGAKKRGILYKITGDLGFYSFSETKNITTSEGGMIVTNNFKISNEIKKIINLGQIYKGTNEAVYPSLDFRKSIEHETIGFTYRMSPILAAIGLVQLEKTESIVKKRREIVSIYKQALKEFPGIILPKEINNIDLCYNTFPIILSEVCDSASIQDKCLSQGLPILKAFYCEILEYKIFSNFVSPNNFTNTKMFGKNNLVLPIFVNLPLSKNKTFIKNFIDIYKKETKC